MMVSLIPSIFKRLLGGKKVVSLLLVFKNRCARSSLLAPGPMMAVAEKRATHYRNARNANSALQAQSVCAAKSLSAICCTAHLSQMRGTSCRQTLRRLRSIVKCHQGQHLLYRARWLQISEILPNHGLFGAIISLESNLLIDLELIM